MGLDKLILKTTGSTYIILQNEVRKDATEQQLLKPSLKRSVCLSFE